MIHTVKSFSIVSDAEVDVFLEFSCFFYDPMDVGKSLSRSSAFSKSSLNIWKFSVHVLLKPSLENFEHYFASVWDEYNCEVVWTFFGIPVCSYIPSWTASGESFCHWHKGEYSSFHCPIVKGHIPASWKMHLFIMYEIKRRWVSHDLME